MRHQRTVPLDEENNLWGVGTYGIKKPGAGLL